VNHNGVTINRTGPQGARARQEMTDYFASTTNYKASDELVIRN